MTDRFRALVARESDDSKGAINLEFEQLTDADLPEQDVLVQVDFSTLNYKDALAVSGKSKICRQLPMVCGIDLAGTVIESGSANWQQGDKVIVNGFGLSETHWGGYSPRQRVSSDWLIRLPPEFNSQQAMAIGTAGYTSMLCVQAIVDHGVLPEHGPVLVTGASGGVGSVAVTLLNKLGYQTVAVSGRPETHDYLKSLGAGEVIDRAQLDRDARPLEKETWGAAVDSVGSKTLATVLATTKREGIVAACGLAGGVELPSSVMPFILRGVTLRGIDSVMASIDRRQRAWNELAKLLNDADIAAMAQLKPLSDIKTLANDLLQGRLKGRIVIDVNR